MTITIPELSAMQAAADAIAHLTPAERRRVAAWLVTYAADDTACAVEEAASEALVKEVAAQEPVEKAIEVEEAAAEPATFAELYAAVAPKTGAQKAATAAYWLETKQGLESWKAFDANKLLKSIGVSVSSISIVLTNAVKSKGALVSELDRTGVGQHSRKTFRLTDAGFAYVEGRLA